MRTDNQLPEQGAFGYTKNGAVIPARRSRAAAPQTNQPQIAIDIEEEDEQFYSQRPHTSIRTYQQPPAPAQQRPRIQAHPQQHINVAPATQAPRTQRPPPPNQNRAQPPDVIYVQTAQPKRRFHPVVLLGSGMVVCALVFLGIYALTTWWTAHQLDATYGMPRTYQTNAIVYPGDTSAHPSHYIFLNLNGQVQIIEEPHGDASHARIYTGPTLIEDNAASVPVTGEFTKVNGKEEMIVHVGDQEIIYLNNGQKFIPQQQ